MDNDKLVRELFTASSRDVTPASLRHDTKVLYVPASLDSEMTRACISLLSETEKRRVRRFSNEYEKFQFAQRRIFRRFCGVSAVGPDRPLRRMVFEETNKGRPYLSELSNFWFSFSSCRFGFLGAWSSKYALGIDFEDHTRYLEALDIANLFFSNAEANTLKKGNERLLTFYQFWSLKEAALKSIGEGLPFGLDAFEFEVEPSLRVVHAPAEWGGAGQFAPHKIEDTGSNCASLVIRKRKYLWDAFPVILSDIERCRE